MFRVSRMIGFFGLEKGLFRQATPPVHHMHTQNKRAYTLRCTLLSCCLDYCLASIFSYRLKEFLTESLSTLRALAI